MLHIKRLLNLLYTYLKTTFKCKYINKKQCLKNPCNLLISLFKCCIKIILGNMSLLGKNATNKNNNNNSNNKNYSRIMN